MNKPVLVINGKKIEPDSSNIKMGTWRKIVEFDNDKSDLTPLERAARKYEIIRMTFAGHPEVTDDAIDESLNACEFIDFCNACATWIFTTMYEKFIDDPNLAAEKA